MQPPGAVGNVPRPQRVGAALHVYAPELAERAVIKERVFVRAVRAVGEGKGDHMPVDARAAERAEIHIAARHHGAHALGEEKRLRVERQIAVVHPEIPGKTGEAPEAPVIKLLSGKRLGGINAVAVVRAGEIALEPLRAELNAAHAAVMREQEIQKLETQEKELRRTLRSLQSLIKQAEEKLEEAKKEAASIIESAKAKANEWLEKINIRLGLIPKKTLKISG